MADQPAQPEISPQTGDWEQHAAFLRRLARRLLADAAAADDALQDAWMAAQRRARAGDVGRGGRTWLAGVVRNVAAQLGRSEARRRAREERAAHDEALPSAADTAARTEILRRVVDAVHALDEPYRTVLLLRFLDELSPGEIARRKGVPVETVRTQVRRGLERVRARLSSGSREATGDESAWLSALLPFSMLPPLCAPAPTGATTSASTAAASAPPSLLTEVLLMSTKTKLALAAGAVASLVVWRFVSADPVAQSPTETPIAALAPAVQPEQEQHASELPIAIRPEADEDRRVAETAAVRAWTVSGNALRVDDPFPGLPLVLRIWERPTLEAIDTRLPPDHEVELTTDAEGAFSATIMGASHAARIAVVKPADGFETTDAGRELTWFPARAEVAPGAVAGELELRLTLLGTALVGTVSDGEGNPIGAATVRLRDDPVATDGNGRYRLPTRSRGQLFVYAEADGYAQVRTLVDDVLAGEERVVDFTLRREFRVTGVVLDRLGQPVADAIVGSFFTNVNEAYTDADGYFELGHLDPGRPVQMVLVKKEGWVLTQKDVPTEADGEAGQDFTLDRGVRVEGRVVDGEGEPVAEAVLYIGFSPHAFNRQDAVSATDGSFVFPSVQRGPEQLVVQREGFGPHQQVLTIPEDVDFLRGVEVVLATGHFVGGHVFDEDNEPLAGVRASVRYHGEHLEVRGETDEEGFFLIEDLPGSDLELSFYAPRQGPRQHVTHEVVSVDVDDLEIMLPRAGSIAGRVVDGATGRPIESFRVRFVDPELGPGEQRLWGYGASWSREGWLFEHEDGEWDTGRESGLAPGAVIGVEVRADGYAPALDPHVVIVLDPEPGALVHELFAGVSLTGTVVDGGSGDPIEGAVVKLYREGETVTVRGSEDTYGRALTRTDGSGWFRFDNVSPGEHRVLVLSDAHANHIDGPFEVRAEAGVNRVIELSSGASVTGTLRDIAGLPRADTVVELMPAGASATREQYATTDGHGAFHFEGLPSGAYLLGPRVGDDELGLREYSLAVELDTGEALAADLAPPGTATIVGWLECDGEPPALLPVSLVEGGGGPDALGSRPTTHGALARDGRFELTGIAAGRYELRVSWRDWRASTTWSAASPETVTIEEGERREVSIRVTRRSTR